MKSPVEWPARTCLPAGRCGANVYQPITTATNTRESIGGDGNGRPPTPDWDVRLCPPVTPAASIGSDELSAGSGRRDGPVASVGDSARERGVVVRPFPSRRRLVTAAVRSGRRIVPMHGLFDVDITTARRAARRARAAAVAHRVRRRLDRPSSGRASRVHAYRDWRGRLVEHRHVDVQTLIEVPTSDGQFGMVHVVRDADVRTVSAISTELRAVKADSTTTRTGRLLDTSLPPSGEFPVSTARCTRR